MKEDVSLKGPGLALVAGIRALGEKDFEEELWKQAYPESPSQIRQRLIAKGLIKKPTTSN